MFNPWTEAAKLRLFPPPPLHRFDKTARAGAFLVRPLLFSSGTLSTEQEERMKKHVSILLSLALLAGCSDSDSDP